MNLVCLTEIWPRVGQFSGLHIEFAQVVIGVVVSWLQFDGLPELFCGLVSFARMGKRGSEVHPCFSPIRLDLHCCVQMINSLVIQGLGGVDHAKKLVQFVASRRVRD